MNRILGLVLALATVVSFGAMAQTTVTKPASASAASPTSNPSESGGERQPRFVIDPNEYFPKSVPPAHEWSGPNPCAAIMARLVPESVLQLPDIPDGGGAGFQASSLLELCWPTEGGTWALVPEGLRGVASKTMAGREVRVFVGGDGRAKRGEILARSAGEVEPSMMQVDGKLRLVFVRQAGMLVKGPVLAYHADQVTTVFYSAQALTAKLGEPRLALFRGEGYHNTPSVAGHAYAVRGDRIVNITLPGSAPYVVSSGDVDRDGIDDLFVDVPYAGDLCQVGCSGHTSVNGPWFLLHGDANGGYSSSDETAVAWAKLQCPRLPDDTVDHFEPYQGLEFWTWIRCKRLWGASTKSVERVLDRYCKPRLAELGPIPCRVLMSSWKTWARAKPPVSLH